MSKQKSLLPVFALILAAILWGTNTVLIKVGVQSIPVTIFMSIRFLAAALVLLPFAIHTWKPLKQRDLLLLIISSIFYISLSALTLNVALTKTTAGNAAVIFLLEPLLLFILSASFLKERLSLRTFIGIMLALAGSLIIIGRPWAGGTIGLSSLTGNLLVVVSVFCGTVSTLICKPLTQKVSVYQLTFLNLFPGIVPIALYALTQLHSWNVPATTTASWQALVTSTISVLFANFLFFYALNYKRAQDTGVYQYLDPLTTIVLAYFLLAERPSVKFALGAALVFLGVYLAEFRLSRKPKLVQGNVG